MQNYLSDEDDIEVAPETEIKPVVRSVRWLRRITAAAAVLAVVLLSTVAVDAFGIDIWGTFAKWTKETFHFASGEQTEIDEPDGESHLPYASLQEALIATNGNSEIVPTRIPDGYQLSDITIDESPVQKTYIAFYRNEDKILKINIRSYLISFPEHIERSEGLLETYESSGVQYYFFMNQDWVQAVWINDLYECHITGDLTIDELKMMIDSIGER